VSKGDFFEKVSSQVLNYDIIDFSYKASTSKMFWVSRRKRTIFISPTKT